MYEDSVEHIDNCLVTFEELERKEHLKRIKEKYDQQKA